MKRIWILIIGLAISLPAVAQQIPLYSQYYLTPFMYNPALTAHDGYFEASGVYRRMWTDIAGAPETRALTLEGSLSDGKVGLGGYAYMDYTDIIERFGGYLSYAYYIKLKKDMRIGLGISAGVQQTRIDWDRANFGDDIIDPIFQNNTKAGVAFDGSAGISFLWKGLTVGFSVPQLVETQVKYLNSDQGTSYTLARHYLATGSYKIGLANDKFFIEPLAMFRYSSGGQWQIDGGANFSWKDIVWLNVMYRYDYAVTFGGGFRVHNSVGVGYAYDMSINNLNGVAGGTHEAFVTVRFGKKDENKGIIEELQKLQQQQDMQQQQIDNIDNRVDTIDQRNQTLNSKNDSLSQVIVKKDAQIEELEGEVKKILEELAKKDEATTGTKADLPDDIVFKGNKSDLEFITGQPDNNYFMVVSSLRTEDKARKMAEKLQKDGHEVGIVYNKRRTWYYVFLSKPGTLENGLKDLYNLRKQSDFKDAWIHIYE